MHNAMLGTSEGQPECLVVKRPYRRPALQIFGKVLHLTQGSGHREEDAGSERSGTRRDRD
jgi:hypothetical protein